MKELFRRWDGIDFHTDKTLHIFLIFERIILCGLRSDFVETREKLQQIKSVLLSKFEDNSLVEELLPFMAVPMEFHVDQFCEERGMEFFQVSSHAGINVATVFHQAMQKYEAYLTVQMQIRQAIRATEVAWKKFNKLNPIFIPSQILLKMGL